MKVEVFINEFRKTNKNCEYKYLNGFCYCFYEILKKQYPKAIPYYSPIHCHVVTKIDDKFYDIRGKLGKNQLKELKLIPYEKVNKKIKEGLEKRNSNT